MILKKILIVITTLISVITISLGFTAEASAYPDINTYNINIVSKKNTKLCLDKKNYYPLTEGTPIQFYTCPSDFKPEWTSNWTFLSPTKSANKINDIVNPTTMLVNRIALTADNTYCISFQDFSNNSYVKNGENSILQKCENSPYFEYNNITGQLGFLNPNGQRMCLDSYLFRKSSSLIAYACQTSGKFFVDQTFTLVTAPK
jgi:hypothetical protein